MVELLASRSFCRFSWSCLSDWSEYQALQNHSAIHPHLPQADPRVKEKAFGICRTSIKSILHLTYREAGKVMEILYVMPTINSLHIVHRHKPQPDEVRQFRVPFSDRSLHLLLTTQQQRLVNLQGMFMLPNVAPTMHCMANTWSSLEHVGFEQCTKIAHAYMHALYALKIIKDCSRTSWAQNQRARWKAWPYHSGRMDDGGRFFKWLWNLWFCSICSQVLLSFETVRWYWCRPFPVIGICSTFFFGISM